MYPTSIHQSCADLGSCEIVHGTMRAQDLLPAFMQALAILAPAAHAQLTCHSGMPRIPSHALEDETAEWWQSEECSWLLNEELWDALNEHAPEGFYFGAHEGDGACYGFWRCEEE